MPLKNTLVFLLSAVNARVKIKKYLKKKNQLKILGSIENI